jgi:hypothetical protein
MGYPATDCAGPVQLRARTAITHVTEGWTAMPQNQATAKLPSPALASTNCQVRSPHLVTRLPAAAEHWWPAPTLRMIFHMDSGGADHRWRRGARRPQHARGQPLLGGQTYLPFGIFKLLFLMCEGYPGLSHRRLHWPSSAARTDCLLSPSTHADSAGPVQLRARTACRPRALMACAVIARLACRGWPAPLTNSGTAVYPCLSENHTTTGVHKTS